MYAFSWSRVLTYIIIRNGVIIVHILPPEASKKFDLFLGVNVLEVDYNLWCKFYLPSLPTCTRSLSPRVHEESRIYVPHFLSPSSVPAFLSLPIQGVDDDLASVWSVESLRTAAGHSARPLGRGDGHLPLDQQHHDSIVDPRQDREGVVDTDLCPRGISPRCSLDFVYNRPFLKSILQSKKQIILAQTVSTAWQHSG